MRCYIPSESPGRENRPPRPFPLPYRPTSHTGGRTRGGCEQGTLLGNASLGILLVIWNSGPPSDHVSAVHTNIMCFSLSLYIYIYIHTYICVCVYIYIYIYSDNRNILMIIITIIAIISFFKIKYSYHYYYYYRARAASPQARPPPPSDASGPLRPLGYKT